MRENKQINGFMDAVLKLKDEEFILSDEDYKDALKKLIDEV